MSRFTRRGRGLETSADHRRVGELWRARQVAKAAAHRRQIGLRVVAPAPYVVVDDGRESREPLIRLTRNAKTSEVAHIIRALSTQLAGEVEPRAFCSVDLAGFTLKNDLGEGVTVDAAC